MEFCILFWTTLLSYIYNRIMYQVSIVQTQVDSAGEQPNFLPFYSIFSFWLVVCWICSADVRLRLLLVVALPWQWQRPPQSLLPSQRC
jgi:hypothetical protein